MTIATNEILANKRILFFLPWLELGGAERQALHLARYLKGLGCHITIWGNSGPGLVADMCDELGIRWAIQRSCWPCQKRHWLRFVWRVARTLIALRCERPDLIIAYCMRPCISSGLTWRWSRASAFIWSQRDCYLQGDLIERFAYRQASAVICNASHELGYLRGTLGETRAPIHVVHNGLALPLPRKDRACWRKELCIPEDAVVATMVANFRFQKDHATLLRAWRILMDAQMNGKPRPHLLLAGAHQESYSSVYQLAVDLNLLDSVAFLGQVTDISGLLTASDIGILTSPKEGLSNSILEYMAAGLPIVATDLPATKEALGENFQDQVCNAGDALSLSSRIAALLDAPDLRNSLGRGNKDRATREFSVGAMCANTVSLIVDLLGVADPAGLENPKKNSLKSRQSGI